MDTRTRSASPNESLNNKPQPISPPQDKISAYYSLVFPHFTFYIQTLSVTIGRRCAPNPNAATSSTAEPLQVDVDLGALKSVSRLHAKIEYDQDEDRFVLVVIGRNGAWVDGVWSGSGTRAPLGERQVAFTSLSQIQIASRTFHFVLPPPPPPEDTPSPSSQSSRDRPRSPSVDITSISPPSSQPSHTPPPPPDEIKLPPPSPEPQIDVISLPPPKPRPLLPSPQLPNSNSIGKSNKVVATKKRKKGDVDPPMLPRPKPEDMPPKPPYTYAQLIYRAIKAIGDKATLQEICTWIMNTHEYYRYSDASWMVGFASVTQVTLLIAFLPQSSVRHNLSSSKAFQKLERCGGDRGKGFFWKLDPERSQSLEEQETKISQATAAGGLQGADGQVRGRKKDKNAVLEPALKRSVKGDLKGTPLPPPLTSTPLPMKNSTPLATTVMPTTSAGASTSPTPGKATPTTPATTGVFAYPTPHAHVTTIPPTVTSGYTGASMSAPNPYSAWTMHPISTLNGTAHMPSVPVPTATTASTSPPPPVLSSSTTSSAQSPPPAKATGQIVPDVNLPIVLGPIPPTHPDYSPSHPHNSAKEGYMILHERTLILDPDVFGELTKETLQGLEKMGMVAALQVLKDHMVKVLKQRRAKGRNKVKRMKGAGKKGASTGNPLGAPLTTAPLERKHAKTTTGNPVALGGPSPPPPLPVTAFVLDPVPMDISGGPPADPGTPIIVVDDSEDEGPAAKRRKVDEVVVV
ncbi:hypothetical protein C0995_013086 [Termitomyces sp. Mi166|nr:hypothetical protein C0995_013086 [Termitomyces sp. Mi166\